MKKYRKFKRYNDFELLKTAIFLCAVLAIKKYGFKVPNYMKNLYFYLAISFMLLLLFNFLKFYIKRKKERQRKDYYLKSGIGEVDRMKGGEFELFLLTHFEKLGYKGHLTQATNDYGADLVLKKNNETVILQAKRYSNKVGIKAIQEIVAAKNYFNADKLMVVTNNYFTNPAKELANSNNVELWDRIKLLEIMDQYKLKENAKSILEKTISKMECPCCHSNLILKNGKFGSFYGCSNYPKCKFTRKCDNKNEFQN